jgi:hypothetical protein
MTELTLPVTTVGTLRCQQTLEPLQQRDDGLYSPSADLLYDRRACALLHAILEDAARGIRVRH